MSAQRESTLSDEEREKIITTALEGQDVYTLKHVSAINHHPHQFTIGPQHITLASDKYGGMIDEKVCREVGCKIKGGCSLSYEEHTYDIVAFMQLLRNATKEEANPALKKVADAIGKNIDGFVFVETKEKFRVA